MNEHQYAILGCKFLSLKLLGEVREAIESNSPGADCVHNLFETLQDWLCLITPPLDDPPDDPDD